MTHGQPSQLFAQTEPMTVLNLGLDLFNEAVQTQDATGVQVNWTPPAGGDLRLIEIIEKLRELDEEDSSSK